MGACYSKGGKDVSSSPKHKSPHKKPTNGLAIKIEYSPVKEHEDDRLSHLVDNNCNHDNKSDDSHVTDDEDNVTSELDKISEIPLIDKDLHDLKQEICVATSDSGIESIPSNETVEPSTSQSLNSSQTQPHNKHDLSFENEEKKCLHCSCGAQNRPPFNYGEFTRSKRNSDLIQLKPSLKKKGHISDRKFRLSWKSSDSLDWTSSFGSSLDRCHSEASDFFVFDELSMRAPLATFDSVDFLGSSAKLCDKSRTNSYISYDSETFTFKFDFSALDTQNKVKCDTAPSTPGIDHRKVVKRQDSRTSSVSCDNVIMDMSKRSSREISHFDSEASLDLSELPSAFQSLQDVKTMQMDGKEVVVIDAELYSQVLEELATLKYKLSQLTDLIQLQSSSGDDYSEVQESTPLNSPRIRTSLNFSKP